MTDAEKKLYRLREELRLLDKKRDRLSVELDRAISLVKLEREEEGLDLGDVHDPQPSS